MITLFYSLGVFSSDLISIIEVPFFFLFSRGGSVRR